jgi:FkbM family methyltransferase
MTTFSIAKTINLKLGRLLEQLGFTICRNHYYPRQSFDPISLGASLIRSSNQGFDDLRIIQVGAFDGLLADPLKELLTKSYVTAILLEPQPGPCRKLKERFTGNTRIKIVNAALSSMTGQDFMFTLDPSNGSATASLSFSHISNFGISKSSLKKIIVSTICVSDLLDMSGWNGIDILQVDTEGFDWQVIKLFFDAKVYPSVVNFERIHLSQAQALESRDILSSNEYSWIDTKYDCLAYKKSLLRQ